MENENESKNSGRSYLSLIGGAIALLAFFAPWAGCNRGRDFWGSAGPPPKIAGPSEMTGANLASDKPEFYIALVAALIIVVVFLIFMFRKQLGLSRWPIIISSVGGIVFLIAEYINLQNQEIAELVTLRWGAFATLFGFLLALIGAPFLKSIKSNVLSIGVLVLLIASACGQTITSEKAPKFDHYGVYIQNGTDFVELKKGNQNDLPKVEVRDEVVLYVYHAKAKTLGFEMYEEGNKDLDPDIVPTSDNDEIVKITAKVFGGPTYLKTAGQKEKYWFDALNTTMIESLKAWLNTNIKLAEKKDINKLINNMSSPGELESMSSEEKEKIANQAKSDPDALNLIIQQMKAALLKIDNGEIIFHPFDRRIWLDTDYFDYHGDGKWKAFFGRHQQPRTNTDDEIRKAIEAITPG